MREIVTRESLQELLDRKDIEYVNQVVGRAVLGLFDRQTASEKHSNVTAESNGVGFTGYDGHSGCLTAKYFNKHKTLLEWQRKMWVKKAKNGFSRLAKYHKQLNEIANEKLT